MVAEPRLHPSIRLFARHEMQLIHELLIVAIDDRLGRFALPGRHDRR